MGSIRLSVECILESLDWNWINRGKKKYFRLFAGFLGHFERRWQKRADTFTDEQKVIELRGEWSKNSMCNKWMKLEVKKKIIMRWIPSYGASTRHNTITKSCEFLAVLPALPLDFVLSMSEWLIHYHDTAKQQTKKRNTRNEVKKSRHRSGVSFVSFAVLIFRWVNSIHQNEGKKMNWNKRRHLNQNKKIRKNKKIDRNFLTTPKRHSRVTILSVFPTQTNKRQTITAHEADERASSHPHKYHHQKSIFRPTAVCDRSDNRALDVGVCVFLQW